jgi:hypothetical protein
MTIHNIIKNIKTALRTLGDALRVAPKKFLTKDYDSGLMIDNVSKKQQQNSEKPTIDSSTYIRQHTTQRD